MPHSHATILYGFKLLIPDGQHGKIVALVGLTGKEVDSSHHALNEGFWRDVTCSQLLLGKFYEALITKLLMVDVLGLVQAIGVQEEGRFRCDGNLLDGKGPVRIDTYGQVWIAW